MSDTRLAPGEVIFILTLVAPGEVVHGAGLSMALLTSGLHQAKADHHLNRYKFKTFSSRLSHLEIFGSIGAHVGDEQFGTDHFSSLHVRQFLRWTQSTRYLVISVMGLDLHPPEDHVDSVLLQEVVDVQMFRFQPVTCSIKW